MHPARIFVSRLPVAMGCRFGHKLVTRELGNPLKVQELQHQDRPKLSSPDNVVLGVIAANINPSDVYAIEGMYPTRPKTLPAPFGLDGVAQVLEVGDNVKHLKPGDRVWPQGANKGKYQTYIECHARQTIPIDKRLSLTQAATLLVNPLTAYFMLKDGNLKKGDTVLQNAANSAAGQCVIQIAREWGINTINIVRSRADINDVRKMLTDLGGTIVMTDDDLKNDALINSIWKQVPRPKLALNAVGGKQVLRMALMMEAGGTCVTYGNMSEQPMMVPTQSFIFQDLKFTGFWLTNIKLDNAEGLKAWTSALQDLTALSLAGKLVPPPCEFRPATEWRKAFEIATAGGKDSNSAKANAVQHRPKQILTFYDPAKP